MKKLTLPTRLPHLDGAMVLRPAAQYIDRGMCFHKTVGFVLDVPMAKLFVGTFRAATPEEIAEHPELSPEPFIHCWPQVGNVVFGLNYISGSFTIPRFPQAAYYQQNGATNVVSMSRARLIQLSRQYGLARHLLYHDDLVGDAKFGSVILDELGVNHVISERGGLIPGD